MRAFNLSKLAEVLPPPTHSHLLSAYPQSPPEPPGAPRSPAPPFSSLSSSLFSLPLQCVRALTTNDADVKLSGQVRQVAVYVRPSPLRVSHIPRGGAANDQVEILPQLFGER